MANVVSYGDITPRTAAYAIKELLTRAMPYMVIERFGQSYPIPANSTKVAKFRRYFLTGATGSAGPRATQASAFYVPLATTPLLEGVTPSGSRLTSADYEVTLGQYGDFTTISDVVEDTHEDPVLQEAIGIMAEQAAMTLETVRWNVLKACTNVRYSNEDADPIRGEVNTPIGIDIQRRITASLLRQNARMITTVVKSTPDYRTEPVEAAFIALCHPDLETDIRKMDGFTPVKQYGQVTPYENEIGAVERVRYLSSTLFAPWPDVGGAKGLMRSTSGTYADVYPVIYLAKDAFGITPLKGKSSITPQVVNPRPAPGDPLGQRGTVGWKAYHAAVILQDAFIVRLECAVTA